MTNKVRALQGCSWTLYIYRTATWVPKGLVSNYLACARGGKAVLRVRETALMGLHASCARSHFEPFFVDA